MREISEYTLEVVKSKERQFKKMNNQASGETESEGVIEQKRGWQKRKKHKNNKNKKQRQKMEEENYLKCSSKIRNTELKVERWRLFTGKGPKLKLELKLLLGYHHSSINIFHNAIALLLRFRFHSRCRLLITIEKKQERGKKKKNLN